MRVTEIFCEVQWSEAVKNGDGWKKVALARKAILEFGDNYQECHQRLYDELAQDLKAKFSHRDPEGNPSRKPDYPESPIPKGTNTGKPRNKKENANPETKMCPIHNTPMKRWTNENGGSWYSHNDETTGGEWCPGKPKKKGNKRGKKK